MSSNAAPSLLSRWLDAEPGVGSAPAELDPDVVEAVYALQPERAPAARVRIEDILAAIDVGPFAAPSPGAAALHRWLDEEDEPDEALDEDVLAAVLALRPDLAPAPRVSIEDILAELDEGPLAPPTAEVIPFPGRSPDRIGERRGEPGAGLVLPMGKGVATLPPPAPVVTPVAQLPPPANQPAHRGRPAWLWPALGALAAAASALLVVGPSLWSGQALRAPPDLPMTASAPASAPAKDEAPMAPPAETVATAVPAAPVEGPPPAMAPPPPAEPRMAPTSGVTANTAGPGYAEGIEGDTIVEQGAKEAPAPVAAGRSAPDVATASAPLYDAEEAELVAETKAPTPAPPPPARPAKVAEREEADALGGVAAMDEAPAAKKAATRAPRGSSAPRPSAAPAAAPASAQGAAAYAEDDVAIRDLSSLRKQAAPIVRGPDLAQRHPELAPTYEAIQKARGDALIPLLRPLLGHEDPDVGQDAAYRLARMHLSAGRTDEALAIIAQGLGRGGAAATSRSRLLALQGEVLERRGDESGAARSYEDAIRAR